VDVRALDLTSSACYGASDMKPGSSASARRWRAHGCGGRRDKLLALYSDGRAFARFKDSAQLASSRTASSTLRSLGHDEAWENADYAALSRSSSEELRRRRSSEA
jgi:hypothetical protein